MLQKSFGGVFCSMGPVSIRSSKDKELNGMKITKHNARRLAALALAAVMTLAAAPQA